MKTSIMDNLNTNQLEAVKEINLPTRIIAGAGSGKTSVITCKILYLMQELNYKLESILALTFTKKAANEMKERVFKALMLDKNSESNILTFHSLCYKILKKNASIIGLSNDFDVVDSYYQNKIINSIIDTDNENSVSVKSMISRIKNNNFRIKNIERRIDTLNGYSSESIEKYNLYQQTLYKNNKLDYDDLMIYTYKLLKDNIFIRNKYIEFFKYILVDEFQDTNNLQWSIVSLLLNGRNSITIVGDPDQTIYTWRGAKQELLLEFEENFSNSKTILLDINYRSNKPIIDIANLLIKNNKKRYEKTLKPLGVGGSEVNIQGFDNIESEAKYISDQIFKLTNEKKYEYRDIYVLSRTNRTLTRLEMALNENNVPYKIKGSNSFFSHKIIINCIFFLRACAFEDDISILSLIETLPKIGPVTVLKIKENSLNEQLSVKEYIKFNSQKYKEIISECMNYITNQKTIKSNIKDLLFDFLNQFGFLNQIKYFEDESLFEVQKINELLNILEEEDKRFFDIPLVERIQNFLLTVTIDEDSELNFDKNNNKVLLSTIHGVKGLENKVVFIFNLNSYNFPRDKNRDLKYLEEERRTFYVAITRAKEILTITYDSIHISEFITEIANVYKSNIFNYKNYDYEIKRINQSIDEVNEKLNNLSIKVGTRINHIVYKEGFVIDIVGNQLKVNFEDKLLGTRLVPILSGVWSKI